MTLQASGAISMSQINTECGSNRNSMSDSILRAVAQDQSGAISFSSLYSKTGKFVGAVSMTGGTPTFPSGSLSGNFINTSFVQIRRNSGNNNAEIDFNSPGLTIWGGGILLTNNTTGVATTCFFVNAQNWQGTFFTNLLRDGTNDTFTIILT
jgi:hypothetical protein